ncbi:(2Fe-2S) ferredoxin domain-containing protein [Leptolyngbya sp. FACHB-261]|uniref:(2Fe-2S) ferredoxin domain-containing protein n=1 Tax=Leptolyngbya sp. FACHB-261 TaxID=2692806 RepID=UPI0016885469|nr:(2Fe-2S) ferredoxin domain-containing protein [Leptolyngbya sp. FACHB-261]MBD2102301.1 (2Fe-2S) ferredoxin domain-containing protein [Leptolyngbya sp. FACHB-261]
MSSHKSPCRVAGRIVRYEAANSGQIKHLRLATAGGEVEVKIPKFLRSTVQSSLPAGTWVEVIGYRKWADSQMEIKAALIVATGTVATAVLEAETAMEPSKPAETSASAKLGTIQVCQKSDCCKRGGTALWNALETELDRQGLSDQVKLKGTGCMKQCKAGPNLVVLPDKTRYTYVKPQQVPQLLEKHFGEVFAHQK